MDTSSEQKQPDESLKKTDSVFGWLGNLVTENRNKIIIAVATAVVSIIGVWMKPLQQIVLHRIYREHVALEIKLDDQSVTEGDAAEAKIVIIPDKDVEVSPGIISVVADRDSIRLRSEDIVKTDRLHEPFIYPLKFEALKHGPS